MKKLLLTAACAAALLAMSPGLSAAPVHLLIQEIYADAIDETAGTPDDSAEFIEIVNPTSNTVSLDNYYITDLVNTAGERYWNLPAADATPGVVAGAANDWCMQFPSGYSLGPGQTATIYGGHLNWTTRETPLPINPAGLQFEVFNSDATPDMVQRTTAANTSLNMTNAGEVFVLFYWDQASDLVTDVDIVSYGVPSAANQFTLRTGTETVDGPDGDAVATAYAADGTFGTSAPAVGASNNRRSVQRTTITENGETATGGNGIGGHNETTENNGTSFSDTLADGARPGTAPTGVPAELSVFSAN